MKKTLFIMSLLFSLFAMADSPLRIGVSVLRTDTSGTSSTP